MDENLVYYKKGSETWGTPVATDCSVLVGNESKDTSMKPSVEVIPNPAETEVHELLHDFPKGDNLDYALYNYSGIKMAEGESGSNTFIISRNDLSAGLYILKVADREGLIMAGTKIIFK